MVKGVRLCCAQWGASSTDGGYPEGCATPGNVQCQCNTQGSLSKLKRTPPQRKINVTSKPPVGDISVVTLIRTDTTLDHSQKAEKVWTLRQWQTGLCTLTLCHIAIEASCFANASIAAMTCLCATLGLLELLPLLGRSPHKNCKNDLDDQT